MRKVVAMCLVLLLSSVLGGCAEKPANQNKAAPTQITVFAAASLQDAAQELKIAYGDKHQDIEISYNFASSGTLQKQIEQGAPADLFISAGKAQMDALEKQELISKDSRLNLLGNKLVLIAPAGSDLKSFDELRDDAVIRIAIGEPATVPAGKYASEVLVNLGLWDQIQPKIVYTKDVRQVLTYVESGDVEAGLVYRSDLEGSKKAQIVLEAPSDMHQPIVYPAALVTASQQQKAAGDFLLFLQSAEAGQIFDKYGFEPLTE